MQEEVNPQRMQLGQEANQILQAAAQPIEALGHYDIELALSGILAKGIECRALVTACGTRNAVIPVDLDDLATHAAGNFA